MDPLGDIVALLRPQTLIWKSIEGRGRWGVCFPGGRKPHFALVVKGACDLQLVGRPLIRLHEGDYVLLPSAAAYSLLSEAQAPAVASDLAFKTAEEGRIRIGEGAGDSSTILVGGQFEFSATNSGLLLSFLPEVVHIPWSESEAERMGALVFMIGREASENRSGRELVLGRLAEIMLVEALRGLEASPHDRLRGLLGGLADPAIAKALRALHSSVQHRWSLVELASIAGMSRTTFARRFNSAVGSPPIDYLLNWRMALAKDRLISGGQSLTGVAESVGYQSASAFSTAFSRVVGCAPAGFAARYARTAA